MRRFSISCRTGNKPRKAKGAKDPDTIALERRLSDALGLKVSIEHKGERGTLQIKYKDLDQLDAVIAKLER